ncbi:MAG: helix-turn-helix transcriptional regulator [Firmicutes bacterium]|nr:helix-turn-helix transcriptional regulator [Bacillota bacterium]
MCCERGRHRHKSGCRCGGVQTGRFLQPCLLLLLHRHTTHGYELMQSLGTFGFTDSEIDPGTVYRHLRKLEEEGLVNSNWDTKKGGPAKRLYELTAEGEVFLHSWAVNIESDIQRLKEFLTKYHAQFTFEERR